MTGEGMFVSRGMECTTQGLKYIGLSLVEVVEHDWLVMSKHEVCDLYKILATLGHTSNINNG